jgi:hypothetical protein
MKAIVRLDGYASQLFQFLMFPSRTVQDQRNAETTQATFGHVPAQACTD